MLLVTGGAGFIGSNFVNYILSSFPEQKLVNLDALTYAGNLENLAKVNGNPNHIFVRGDICDSKLLEELFEKYPFDAIINFAAESHVDRSINDPQIFLKTNIIGTQTLLDVAMQQWKENIEDKYCRKFKVGKKFIQVSTDEVYGSLQCEGKFNEDTPIAPNSPYSASKAAADLIVRAYFETYGLPVNITRCSNNYGPYQFPEKLIPLMINNCVNDEQLPVYGDGLNIRDWLHVQDHCEAIYLILQKGVAGQVYNIGGNNEKTNIEIVKMIITELGKNDDLITYVKDRPGHDRHYAIDSSKITLNLGWTPRYTFEQGIKDTIRWYLNNKKWLKNITSGEYKNYYKKMYS